MHIKFGSFAFLPEEAGLSVRAEFVRSSRGFKQFQRVRYGIDGELCIPSGQYDITTRINQIIAAFSTDDQNIGLYHDNNAISSHFLSTTTNNLSGNQVADTHIAKKWQVSEHAPEFRRLGRIDQRYAVVGRIADARCQVEVILHLVFEVLVHRAAHIESTTTDIHTTVYRTDTAIAHLLNGVVCGHRDEIQLALDASFHLERFVLGLEHPPIADFATRSLGIGYPGGSLLLLGLLLASLFVWHRTFESMVQLGGGVATSVRLANKEETTAAPRSIPPIRP